MSQALRVALWVPTEDPPEVGDGVLTKAAQLAANVLPTRFALASGGGGGGIPEAPFDGKTYGRNDGLARGRRPAAVRRHRGSADRRRAIHAPGRGWMAFPAVLDAGTY